MKNLILPAGILAAITMLAIRSFAAEVTYTQKDPDFSRYQQAASLAVRNVKLTCRDQQSAWPATSGILVNQETVNGPYPVSVDARPASLIEASTKVTVSNSSQPLLTFYSEDNHQSLVVLSLYTTEDLKSISSGAVEISTNDFQNSGTILNPILTNSYVLKKIFICSPKP